MEAERLRKVTTGGLRNGKKKGGKEKRERGIGNDKEEPERMKKGKLSI